MHTIALQVRRLESEEPEDKTFVLRWWADLQFLIVALRRLRRAAELAATADDENGRVRAALNTFDRRLPALAVMRNVGEHLDAYGADSPTRHRKTIDRRQLQVGTFDGYKYRWLVDEHGQQLELDIDEAKAAAEELFSAICRRSPWTTRSAVAMQGLPDSADVRCRNEQLPFARVTVPDLLLGEDETAIRDLCRSDLRDGDELARSARVDETDLELREAAASRRDLSDVGPSSVTLTQHDREPRARGLAARDDRIGHAPRKLCPRDEHRLLNEGDARANVPERH